MVRVVNAKNVEGGLFSFRIGAGRFAEVCSQDQLVRDFDPASPAIALADLTDAAALPAGAVVDAQGALIAPAGIDVHVHSREPGLAHKEDWQSLARAAWRGGVVAVADMPNTLPPTMTQAAVEAKAALARASGLEFRLLAGVGARNVESVAQLLALPDVCALKVFYGKTTGELMYDDLETLARTLPADGQKLVVFHSEDQCTVDGNLGRLAPLLHQTDNAAFTVHSEIRSSEAAHKSTRVILEWARISYKRPIHIAHVSTPLEVELVAEARERGVPVTCEVAPHHLLFSTADYPRLGPLVKMNPPLRSPAEVESLRRLVGQGLVDLFATDHAPHLLAEKRVEIARSPSGVPALELYYPLLLEVARVTGLSLPAACAMGATRPAALFGFSGKGAIADGFAADFVWLSPDARQVKGEEVVSKCGWTPYDGWQLPGDVLATWNHGRQVYPAR